MKNRRRRSDESSQRPDSNIPEMPAKRESRYVSVFDETSPEGRVDNTFAGKGSLFDARRTYRQRVKSADLVTFQVTIKETDLLISAEKDVAQEAHISVWKYRRQIEAYIKNEPSFKWSLTPWPVDIIAPEIVRTMASAAAAVGVGPMASVAGAVAEFVGRDLLQLSPQIIIENGGDIFLATQKKRIVSIFTEGSSSPSFIDIVIKPEKTPLGICTSSGKDGPSFSFGRSDSVTVIAPSAALADAAATAAGNLVRSGRDVMKALDFLRGTSDVVGAAVLVDGQIGLWGDIELLEKA